jgi:hypothetical protein
MFGSEGIEVIYAKTLEEGRIQPTINNLIQNVKKQRQEIYKLNEYLISNKVKSKGNYQSKKYIFKKGNEKRNNVR